MKGEAQVAHWLRRLRRLTMPPAAGLIHVWLLHLDHFHAHSASLGRLLDASERLQAARLQFDLDRTRFVTRRGLRRLILGACLRRRPGSLRYLKGPAPPRLVEGNLCFSSSHAGPLAVLTVAREQTGVDIERSDQPVDPALSLYCFDEALNKRSSSLTDELPSRSFARFWARGEAITKAGLRPFVLPFTARDVFNPELQIIEWIPAPGYVAVIAARGNGWFARAFSVPPLRSRCVEWLSCLER